MVRYTGASLWRDSCGHGNKYPLRFTHRVSWRTVSLRVYPPNLHLGRRILDCKRPRKLVLAGRTEIDPSLAEPFAGLLDVLGARLGEILPVRLCDPEPRLHQDCGVCKLCDSDRRFWFVENRAVVVGRVQQNSCRGVDIVGVADADRIRDPQCLVAHPVGDRVRRQHGVRDRHRLVVERPDSRDTKADIVDEPGAVLPLDPVVDVEVGILDDEHAGNEIREHVLCCKTDRQRECSEDERRTAEQCAESGRPRTDGDCDYDSARAEALLDGLFECRREVPPRESAADQWMNDEPDEEVHEESHEEKLHDLPEQERIFCAQLCKQFGNGHTESIDGSEIKVGVRYRYRAV